MCHPDWKMSGERDQGGMSVPDAGAMTCDLPVCIWTEIGHENGARMSQATVKRTDFTYCKIRVIMWFQT